MLELPERLAGSRTVAQRSTWSSKESVRERIAPATSLSVIIPVYNSATELGVCLRALGKSEHQPGEVIVVDDGSTDGSSAVASLFGATVVSLERNVGPAVARNQAAMQASGEILVFLDADTEVHPEALGIIARRFDMDDDLDAVFGSYDDSPRNPWIVSQFRNLLHCHTHRAAPKAANTFWTGCGALRRGAFRKANGFDESYSAPSVEDVDLGMRLARAGRRIEVDPSIQVKHLKCWTLRSMIRTDLFHRGIPFGELMVREKSYPRVLGNKQLASVLLVGAMLLVGLQPFALAVGFVGYLGVNGRFLRFLAAKGGGRLVIPGFGLLLIYHLCAALGVSTGAFRSLWRTLVSRPAALAVLAALAVGYWQSITVRVNFHSDGTVLDCVGEHHSCRHPDHGLFSLAEGRQNRMGRLVHKVN